MPLYEYICQECGERFDALSQIKEADRPIACAHCHSERTTRQLSVFNAHSGGKIVTTSSAGNGCGCGSCGGGNCAHCGN